MPVQVMSADQHPGRKSCDDHHRRRKKHHECHDDEDDCDDDCNDDDCDDDCDTLTDEKYSLCDIVKIMKHLRECKCDDHDCNECNECEDCDRDHHDSCEECCPLDEVGCAYGPTENCDLCSKPPICQHDDCDDGCKKCKNSDEDLINELLCDKKCRKKCPPPPCMCPPDYACPQNRQVDTLDEINSFYTFNDPIPGCGCGYLAEVNATHDANATQPPSKSHLMALSGEAKIGDQEALDLPENADFILLSTSASIISEEGKRAVTKVSDKKNSKPATPNPPKTATKPSEHKLSDTQANTSINPEIKKSIAKAVKPLKDAALGYIAKKIQEEIRR